ncbi:hypothetical protein ACFQE5_02390 [Pseudonocardia hispaniensis]|uniref:Uncharacterized protein n=1 Tax=Pseudonocardia hispaniensis TaxID=904933 RepID=A0ABW1IXU5_9PSEU
MRSLTSNSSCRYLVTSSGERIGYDMCFAPDCMQHVSRCTCPQGPTPPHLGPGVEAVVEIPFEHISAA